MAETKLQLMKAGNTFLDASGNGTVTLGPGAAGERWVVKSVVVQTSTATLIPQAQIYNGPSSPSNIIATTYTGSNDTASGGDIALGLGQFITVTWTDGDPGAVAYATVYGDQILLGRRIY